MRIDSTNYEYYKEIFAFIWDYYNSKSRLITKEEHSPIAILTKMEKESFSLAKKGLKMGMSDLIQMVNGQSEAFKKELNELLIASDLPSLKRLNAQIKNIAQKVLKGGEIKSESEYYIIKEVLIDLSLKLPQEERERLTQCMLEYELKEKK
ncbi:MAG: hypothetical protein R8P61_20575 [Bacteroidia bacterium]|nr:hypothetical protein [Bacteroidia bacterium]